MPPKQVCDSHQPCISDLHGRIDKEKDHTMQAVSEIKVDVGEIKTDIKYMREQQVVFIGKVDEAIFKDNGIVAKQAVLMDRDKNRQRLLYIICGGFISIVISKIKGWF